MAETFEAHTAIISNHPAYHPWLTLYIWRYIGLTLDRIARWRKPVHVIRVEFNFLRTRDARVAHRVCVCVHACIFTRVIRTTRWKRMDKEGRGQEPGQPSVCQYVFDRSTLHHVWYKGCRYFSISFVYICSCVDLCALQRCVSQFLEIGLYVCVLAIVEVVKKIGWREREEEVGGILDEWAEKRLLNGM